MSIQCTTYAENATPVSTVRAQATIPRAAQARASGHHARTEPPSSTLTTVARTGPAPSSAATPSAPSATSTAAATTRPTRAGWPWPATVNTPTVAGTSRATEQRSSRAVTDPRDSTAPLYPGEQSRQTGH